MTISVTFKVIGDKHQIEKAHHGYKGALEIHSNGKIQGQKVYELECYDPEFFYWAQNFYNDLDSSSKIHIVLECPFCGHEWPNKKSGDSDECPHCGTEFED